VSARRRLYFPKVVIRLGVVALLALALQVVAIVLPADAGVFRRVLFVSSYLLLVAFVAANWRRPGLAVIGVGLLLNLAPILANGGLMPVTPEAIHRIGQEHRIEGREDGDAIPNTKNVLKEKENTRLWFLSDRLVWKDSPFVFRVFSIGDVVIAAGLLVTVAEVVLPRVGRAPAGEAPGAGAA
jgi:hypothetical protein